MKSTGIVRKIDGLGRVVRPIGEEDRLAYDHGRPVPPEFL